MSIWSELLSLHGYVTHIQDNVRQAPAGRAKAAEEADRLRELIGCRPPSSPPAELRGPLLGVRGLT